MLNHNQKISELRKQALKKKFQWQVKKGYVIWQSGIVETLNNNGLVGLFCEILAEAEKKNCLEKWLVLAAKNAKQKTQPKKMISPRIEAREKKVAAYKNRIDLFKRKIQKDKRRLRDRFLRDLGGLFEEVNGDVLFAEETDQKKCEQILFGALIEKANALKEVSKQEKLKMIGKWKDGGDAFFTKKQAKKPPIIVSFAKEPPLQIKQLFKKEYRAHYNPVRCEWYVYGDLQQIKSLLNGVEAKIICMPL